MICLNLLTVSNPSDYWRFGHVTLPWQALEQEFKIPPEEIILRYLRYPSDDPLTIQIDDVDPEDPSRKTLSFFLNRAIPPGTVDYSTASTFIKAERGSSNIKEIDQPCLVASVPGADGRVRGVKLTNNRLNIWLNLVPAPEEDQRNWYAGAATSVLLDGKEILDLFRETLWFEHDQEKRCMQIDLLRLPSIDGDSNIDQSFCLFNQPWQLVYQNSGAVRAVVTIASPTCKYGDRVCQLYRTISLYAGADYVIEELFIKGSSRTEQETNQDSQEMKNLDFKARYFAHMDMGLDAKIHRFFVPDWFAVGSDWAPNPGYGFATDVHAGPVASFFADEYLPDPPDKYKRFSWELLSGNPAKCLHLFMQGQKGDFDSRIGKAWYEHIYKPLKSEIYQEQPFGSNRAENAMLTFT